MHNSVIFGIIGILAVVIVCIFFITNFCIEKENIIENVVEQSNNL